VGRTFLEFPGLARRDPREIVRQVRFQGWEHVLDALKENRGVLLLTGHLGNWEIMALSQGFRDAPPPLAFVARPLDNPYLERWVSRIRCRSGNRVIPKRGALRQVLRSLREGYAVGMLMDQRVAGSAGVKVEFFFHPAGTSAAIAYLAVRHGSPVVPVYALRDPGGYSYTVNTEPRIEVSRTGKTEYDVWETTRRCQKKLEEVIRNHPDQWFWMHRRWWGAPRVSYARKKVRNPVSRLLSGKTKPAGALQPEGG
jgi:KDO2-lipid IV(A) lauroyltransferase